MGSIQHLNFKEKFSDSACLCMCVDSGMKMIMHQRLNCSRKCRKTELVQKSGVNIVLTRNCPLNYITTIERFTIGRPVFLTF